MSVLCLGSQNFDEDASEGDEEPEEESEEDIMAESIIHGNKKKIVPRIRTGRLGERSIQPYC